MYAGFERSRVTPVFAQRRLIAAKRCDSHSLVRIAPDSNWLCRLPHNRGRSALHRTRCNLGAWSKMDSLAHCGLVE